jgi:2'-hydroxyisoflavone reductase
MNRVLILGGTAWLGREIARRAVQDGAEVTCLARGASGPAPDGVRLARADRRVPGAYDAVDGDWDEVVELSSDDGLVAPALEALGDRARHWTLVSTVSVYARNDEVGADESAETVEPNDPGEYADAKVAAERATTERVGDRLLIARPGLVVGTGDPSDRFGYWPGRMRRGGVVLSPRPAGRFVQVIDVDDLATWIAGAGARGTVGTVNTVGDPVEFGAFLAETADVAGFEGEVVTFPDDDLLDAGVHFWAGESSLPLWLPLADAAFALRSNAAFRAAGGALRPLRETLARTLEDEISRGLERPRRSGLTAEQERRALDAAFSTPNGEHRPSWR